MRLLFLLISFFLIHSLAAQKKPLDHSVYDNWESIGEKLISNDGNWIVYTVNVQEGDNQLVIESPDKKYRKVIPRGYNAVITEDSRFVICRIKPFYKDIREARIKKKKPDDFPQDSLAITKLGSANTWKLGRVKSFKTPEKSFGWVAYHMEKIPEPAKPKRNDEKRVTDSLNKLIDSLKQVIELMPEPKKKKKGRDEEISDEDYMGSDAEGDETAGARRDAGTNLVLRKLETGVETVFHNVLEYYFNKSGRKLLIEVSRNPKDSLSRPMVILYDLRKGFGDTLSRGGNDYRNFALSDDGAQVAYVAEREARPKDLQKFYKLWYYKEGMDSALLLADRFSPGMNIGMTISEYGSLSFSKSGKRLFFGVAPVPAPKDTSLVDIDLVKLDIWHYNDDYLQPAQLRRLQRSLEENFLAVYLFDSHTIHQLESREIPQVYRTGDGDGDTFIAVTDFGKRIESQWMGTTKKDIYAVNVGEGKAVLVKKDLNGVVNPFYSAPSGKYIMWYDSDEKDYFVWNGKSIRNITSTIKVPLYNEDHDSPSAPPPYGVMGWQEGDSLVYIYDKYDVWVVDPTGKRVPFLLPPFNGRSNQWIKRLIRTEPDDRYINSSATLLFNIFNDKDKSNALWYNSGYFEDTLPAMPAFSHFTYRFVTKAKDKPVFIYTKENFISPPDLYFDADPYLPSEATRLSSINTQQQDYNWGTAELFSWKTFKGKPSEGIVYKPEDFDPKKKYPLIVYFYEELSDGLNNYIAPSPTPSRINITFFVSRGYIVFAPDIKYTIGHPAQSAYDYIVSGTQALAKNKWIDINNMGIQGQSWGGIQVAQLITMTSIFKAAWAGAPVANMTSAYGGIRWQTGVNRQFQYEKTQSRIGATLWEKPELYIENSPLFHLPKVTTPLVIMANDADGAVPWYQGIELFTGLRRLGKKVWLLDYNGEAHNLVERKNRKDIQIRQQQYFDWLLKGAHPPKWITEGVPAVNKGKDWGLEEGE